MRVAFSQSGSGLEEEPSLQQLKFVHAPLPCSVLALAGPSHSHSHSGVALALPFCPGAHLSCPQRPTVLARALAVTGCRAAAHMGKKAKHGSPAGRGREGQGALPLSKITACMHTVLYGVLN